MEFIKIDKDNIDNEHFGCALSNKEETASKREWLKENLDNGYTFLKLNDRGKVFIEYVDAKYAAVPIKADNYLFIDCFWVSGKFKGHGIGKQLLQHCIDDAKAKGYDGIVALTADKKRPFLSDPKFYKMQGFEVVDKLEPYYELVCYKLNKEAKDPEFIKNGTDYVLDEGITIIYSRHCPWTSLYAKKLEAIAKEENVPIKLYEVKDYQMAKQMANPFTTYAFYDNGEFITNEIFSEKKLDKYLNGRRD